MFIKQLHQSNHIQEYLEVGENEASDTIRLRLDKKNLKSEESKHSLFSLKNVSNDQNKVKTRQFRSMPTGYNK